MDGVGTSWSVRRRCRCGVWRRARLHTATRATGPDAAVRVPTRPDRSQGARRWWHQGPCGGGTEHALSCRRGSFSGAVCVAVRMPVNYLVGVYVCAGGGTCQGVVGGVCEGGHRRWMYRWVYRVEYRCVRRWVGRWASRVEYRLRNIEESSCCGRVSARRRDGNLPSRDAGAAPSVALRVTPGPCVGKLARWTADVVSYLVGDWRAYWSISNKTDRAPSLGVDCRLTGFANAPACVSMDWHVHALSNRCGSMSARALEHRHNSLYSYVGGCRGPDSAASV
jgi:hypothetical protein